MADFYLKSGSGATERANSTAYSSGNRMVPLRSDTSSNVAVARRWVWECTTGGTSSGSLPTWPGSVTQDSTTVSDGSVTWTARKPGFSSGSTADWTFAAIFMDYVATAMAVGDRLFVSDGHAESTTVAINTGLICTFPGTVASPNQVLCVDDSAAPPTALATTATVTTTGNYELTIKGSLYCYGISFVNGNGTNQNSATIILDNLGGTFRQRFQSSVFSLASTNGAVFIQIGSSNGATGGNGGLCEWVDCDFKLGAASQFIRPVSGKLHITGGSMPSGTSSPTTALFRLGFSQRGAGSLLVEGCDFVNGGTGLVFFDATNSVYMAEPIIRNCKLPTSWAGTLWSATPIGPTRAVLNNCDSGPTNYRIWVEDHAGSIKQETTIVRTGGASDGTTTLSWKMVSSANAEYPVVRLESPEMVIWNDTSGSSKTVTIEIVHDSQGAGSGSKFQDDEIWLEVRYLGASGFPLGALISDAKADVFATAANQADSSETWTTTGLTTPVKQALSVTFTPQEKGYIHARVVLAKASKTVYVDPELTVT